jgi:hypothetical protein
MTTAWTDPRRQIAGKIEVNWSKDGSTWVDESERLISLAGKMALALPWRAAGGGGDQDAWTMTAEMRNDGDRYSALNAGSPIYSAIQDNKGHGIPIRFSVGLDDGAGTGNFAYTRQFTGLIDQIAVTSTVNNRASFACLDNSLALAQNKEATTLYTDQTASEWIAKLAGDAGITTLDLDAGIFPIPFLWMSGENIWPEMIKVARAEGGNIFFDVGGTLVYENMEAFSLDARHTISQGTITLDRARDIAPAFSWKDAYNEVAVEYQPRSERGRQIVYESDRAIRLLPGQTQTVPCLLRYPCAAIFDPVAGTDFQCRTETGQDAADDVDMTVLANYAQRVDLEFTNNSSYRLAYVHRLKIRGKPVMGYQSQRLEIAMDDAAIGTDVPKVLPIADNEYLQTHSQANAVGSQVADAVKTARLTYKATDIPGIPGWQPGDLVTVVEAGSGIDDAAFITAINWRFGGGAFRFTQLEAIDAAGWHGYSDDADGYFLLGTDVLGGAKRIFY